MDVETRVGLEDLDVSSTKCMVEKNLPQQLKLLLDNL